MIYATTQVALGSVAESNFWAERRHNSHTTSQQMAFAPDNVVPIKSGSSLIVNQLPHVETALSVAWQSNPKNKTLPLSLQNLLSVLSLTPTTVQSVHVGKNTDAPVLLIQDVHMNAEAQSNIAEALQALIDQKGIGLIGLEGAFRPLNLRPFRLFDDRVIKCIVGRSMLDHRMLGAPSYVGLVSETEPPAFVGVDDRDHYDANVKAYLDSGSQRGHVEQTLARFSTLLAAQKQTAFTPSLKHFDELRTAYHDGSLAIGSYVEQLSAISGNVDNDLTLEQFLEAYQLEKHLNFTVVEQERTRVIEKLSRALSEAELKDLFNSSLAYRMGQLGYGAYYQSLRKLCETKGILLSQTPAFAQYVQYVLLADGVRADDLFESIYAIERHCALSLVTTLEQKRIADGSEWLSLTRRLIDFSLTPKEWKHYRELSAPLALDLSSFEAFYEHADVRSEKMLTNLFTAARKTNASMRPVVLVIGGFHAPEVAASLSNQNRSYVIVSPKITKIDDANSATAYLSVFAQQKTTLDQLFEGQKLFINPESQVLDNAAAVRTYASLAGRKLTGNQPGKAEVDIPKELTPALIKEEIQIRDPNDVSQDEIRDPPQGLLFRPMWARQGWSKPLWSFVLGPLWEEGVFTVVAIATGQMWLYFLLRTLFVLGHFVQRTDNSFQLRFNRNVVAAAIISLISMATVGYLTGGTWDIASLNQLTRVQLTGVLLGVHSLINFIFDFLQDNTQILQRVVGGQFLLGLVDKLRDQQIEETAIEDPARLARQRASSQETLRYRMKYFRESRTLLDDSDPLQRASQKVFKNLVDVLKRKAAVDAARKLELAVFSSSEVNAYFLVHTDNIFSASELIRELDSYLKRMGRGGVSDDHIAVILAHELQHAVQNFSQKAEEWSDRFGDRRKKEYDADIESLFTADDAGYNPNAMVDVMNFFIEAQSNPSLMAMVHRALDDHPDSVDRRSRLTSILSDKNIFFRNSEKEMQPLHVDFEEPALTKIAQSADAQHLLASDIEPHELLGTLAILRDSDLIDKHGTTLHLDATRKNLLQEPAILGTLHLYIEERYSNLSEAQKDVMFLIHFGWALSAPSDYNHQLEQAIGQLHPDERVAVYTSLTESPPIFGV